MIEVRQVKASPRTHVVYFKRVRFDDAHEAGVFQSYLWELKEFLRNEVGGRSGLREYEIIEGKSYFKLEFQTTGDGEVMGHISQLKDKEVEKIRNSDIPVWFATALMDRVKLDKQEILKLSLNAGEDATVTGVQELSLSAMISAFPSADELKAGLYQKEVDMVYEVVKILGKLEVLKRCGEKMVVVSYLSGDAQKMLTEKGYIVESGSTLGNMCRVKA